MHYSTIIHSKEEIILILTWYLKENWHLCDVSEELICSDINSSKCLHVMSSNTLFCTHCIFTVTFLLGSMGKTITAILEFLTKKEVRKISTFFVLKKNALSKAMLESIKSAIKQHNKVIESTQPRRLKLPECAGRSESLLGAYVQKYIVSHCLLTLQLKYCQNVFAAVLLDTLTVVLLNLDMPCLYKQCRSRSEEANWFGSALFAIHMCIYIHNLD